MGKYKGSAPRARTRSRRNYPVFSQQRSATVVTAGRERRIPADVDAEERARLRATAQGQRQMLSTLTVVMRERERERERFFCNVEKVIVCDSLIRFHFAFLGHAGVQVS